ncbi:acyltransferase [Bradyrhizobium sp. 139]|uniref:acyltransferase family protein n=1 Tax=Bradyrhizobium sp. 139 TaxID=2782616 RepID=UPI001FFBBC01|nr:acyltransferase [Bradyrhizobium sp. 139]MCK1740404.1 acyltransferase [Bradyrhizobium sp. 139]
MLSVAPTANINPKKSEIIGIQYLRGIAALAVVLDHSAGMGAFEKYFGVVVFDDFLKYGAHGVDIFFLLSGFIIAYVALRPATFHPELTFGQFFLRRAIRILPLMWLAIGSYAALRILGGATANLLDYLRAATLFPVGQVAPLNIWTLRHEMLFYGLFGLSWLAYRRIRYSVFLWFAAPLMAVVSADSSKNEFWNFLFNPVNLEFGAGFCLGLLYLRTNDIKPTIRYQLGILVAATLLMISLAFLCGYELGTLKSTIFACACSALIVALAAFTRPVKCNRFGVFLGEASYSIYLFHPHIISATLRLLKYIAPTMPPQCAIFVAASSGIVGGIIIHTLVEKPLLKRLKNGFSLRRTSELPLRRTENVDYQRLV